MLLMLLQHTRVLYDARLPSLPVGNNCFSAAFESCQLHCLGPKAHLMPQKRPDPVSIRSRPQHGLSILASTH